MKAPTLSNSLPYLILPQGALAAGHQHTKVAGSATACVLQLDPEHKTLEAANLVSVLIMCAACPC